MFSGELNTLNHIHDEEKTADTIRPHKRALSFHNDATRNYFYFLYCMLVLQ